VRALHASLEELPAVLERCALLVTGDSGPMHVAEAVGTPVVALFGPTTGHFGFRPFLPASRVVERALRCRPCHVHGGDRCPLIHHRCMNDISVLDVYDTTGRLLDEAAPADRSRLRQEVCE
jgi:ADP-heptose:LPS heptosyltransferase